MYTRGATRSGTADDKAIINATMYLVPNSVPSDFQPEFVYIATWNKMKYSSVDVRLFILYGKSLM